MCDIFVTLLVSHPEISALNVTISRKAPFILVTRLVFHSGIDPYSLAEHLPSAAWRPCSYLFKQVSIASKKFESVSLVTYFCSFELRRLVWPTLTSLPRALSSEDDTFICESLFSPL